MRSLTYIFVSITLFQSIVSACCQVKKIGACCGKGKCNIFCCNCNGGCLSTDICSYRHCEDACAKKHPSPGDLAACITKCYFGGDPSLAAEGISVSEGADKMMIEVSKTPQHVLNAGENAQEESEGLAATDEQLFYEVDHDRVGYFTYGQFLTAMDWEDNEYSSDHFVSFDRNGDGRITLDEMRN